MTVCIKCGKEFTQKSTCISGEAQGDEYTDCWFFCDACGVYTINSIREPFMGEEENKSIGPITKENGDNKVALIGKCATPWEKNCDCEAHKKYFGL